MRFMAFGAGAPMVAHGPVAVPNARCSTYSAPAASQSSNVVGAIRTFGPGSSTSPTSDGAIGWTSNGAIIATPSLSAEPATLAASSWNCVDRTIRSRRSPPRPGTGCCSLR